MNIHKLSFAMCLIGSVIGRQCSQTNRYATTARIRQHILLSRVVNYWTIGCVPS